MCFSREIDKVTWWKENLLPVCPSITRSKFHLNNTHSDVSYKCLVRTSLTEISLLGEYNIKFNGYYSTATWYREQSTQILQKHMDRLIQYASRILLSLRLSPSMSSLYRNTVFWYSICGHIGLGEGATFTLCLVFLEHNFHSVRTYGSSCPMVLSWY